MEVLEAALAFAVAMIIFSTMATGLVEVVLRIFHTKPRLVHEGIRRMLDDRAEAAGLSPDQKDAVADALTRNPAAGAPEARSRLARRLDPDGHGLRIDALSSYAFLARLSETDLAQQIRDRAADLADESMRVQRIEAELAHWQTVYERYRATTNERFRKRAQALTVWLAVILALVFNIHAGRLFLGVMGNEGADLRAELIASAEDTKEAYDAAQARLDATLARLEAALADDGTAGAEATGTLQSQLADLRAAVAPETLLLPVGDRYFPHCRLRWLTDHYNAKTCTGDVTVARDWLLWGFNAVLAGFLIGLGGPFWYRVFSSLSQLAQALKAFGSRKGGSDEMLGGTLQSRPETLSEADEKKAMDAVARDIGTRSAKPTDTATGAA